MAHHPNSGKTKKGIITLNYQTNRNNCSCTGESRCNSCPYGRTPWGTREGGTCNRRPWNTRSGCGCSQAPRSSSCPCTANTTWKNRGEGCSCGTSRTVSPCTGTARTDCACTGTDRTASCPLSNAREGECDTDCNHGAINTGILDGKSLAMVYSPYQRFDSLYDPRQGLCNGTIFGELNKPFYGDGRGC